MKAGELKTKLTKGGQQDKLKAIVLLESTIPPDELIIYEMDEKAGTINRLEPMSGLPSDKNELNELLGESNELFAQLLEIQQSL